MLKVPRTNYYNYFIVYLCTCLDDQEVSLNTENNNINQDSAPMVMPKLRINLTNLNAASNSASVPTLPPSALEEQFILRLPPSLTSILNSELVENEYTSPGDLSIKFVSSRTAIIKHPRFIKEAYPAVLVDSPTVMETLKSSNLSIVGIVPSAEIDEKDPERPVEEDGSTLNFEGETEINVGQYYKVADLNQILMVLDLDTTEGQRVFNRVPGPLQDQLLKALQQGNNNNFINNPVGLDDMTAIWAQWPDGLTPPMRAAKTKKFASRPVHASNVGDLERIEREVERLMKSDGQAIESKFTLYGVDGEVLLGDLDKLTEDFDMEEAGEDVDNYDKDVNDEGANGEDANENVDENEEYSSSASDIEDMNDFAAEIEDNLLENVSNTTETEPSNNHEQSPPLSTSITLTTPLLQESETDRLVKDLETKLAEKVKQAQSVSNPLIKARIEDVIRQMEDNLRNLRG